MHRINSTILFHQRLIKKIIMKTLKIIGITVVFCLIACSVGYAQKGTLVVTVKGIKEPKGNLMIAFGDKSRPQEMVFSMLPITSVDKVVCVLKDVPVGSGSLSAYQDLNENHQLDKDENQVPIELCYTKDKVTVKEGENSVEIKLINVKEMMGTK